MLGAFLSLVGAIVPVGEGCLDDALSKMDTVEVERCTQAVGEGGS